MREKPTPAEIVAAYDDLVSRALYVVGYVDNDEFVRLEIDGDNFTVRSLEINSGYYGSWETSTNRTSFSADLLVMSDDEVVAWKKQQEAEAEARWKAQQVAAKHAQQLQEFALYQQLARKFGK